MDHAPAGRVVSRPNARRRSTAWPGVGLGDRAGEPVKFLSYGERRQLELALALNANPKVLLLDEPCAGLSPSERQRFSQLIAALPRDITLIMIEHDIDVALGARRPRHRAASRQGHPRRHAGRSADQCARCGRCILAAPDRSAVRDIHTYYGDSYVLHGREPGSWRGGEIVAILGRNGMGKTTLIRSVAGLTPPRRGECTFRGASIVGKPPYAIAQAGIAIVPQGRRIFRSLIGAREPDAADERARAGARTRSIPDASTGRSMPCWRNSPSSPNGSTMPAARSRGGEQQMLAIGRALMANPRLILMDEPSEGLSPKLVQQVEEIMRACASSGHAILLVEQNLALALSVADDIYVISSGRFVFRGSAADLARRAADARPAISASRPRS